MSFNQLPPEIQEQILRYTDDYKTIARVSKDWKHYVFSSKKMMQRALDDFFFFFSVKLGSSLVILPIATEKQFFFLRKYAETTISHVGALEKTDHLEKLFWDEAYDFDLLFSSDTEDIKLLIRGIKMRGKASKNIIKASVREVLEFSNLDATVSIPTKGPKFSDPNVMRELLQNEHKIIRDCKCTSLFIVTRSHYARLDKHFRDMLATAEHKGDDEMLTLARNSYATLTRSLFKLKCWDHVNRELKTRVDYEELTEY